MQVIVTCLVVLLALHHLIYLMQNLINPKQAFDAMAAVFSQDQAPVYPRSIMPAIRHPVPIGLALVLILAMELAAGLLLAWGAIGMLGAFDSPGDFAAAGQWAMLGCGVALVLWFGLFLTVGAALFQMWQTQLGQGAMGDAFRSGMFSGLVLLLLQFV